MSRRGKIWSTLGTVTSVCAVASSSAQVQPPGSYIMNAAWVKIEH